MADQLVQCDKCKKKFQIIPRSIVLYAIQYHYFQCPGCKYPYYWNITTGRIDRLKQERVQNEKEIEKLKHVKPGSTRIATNQIRNQEISKEITRLTNDHKDKFYTYYRDGKI